MAGTTKMRNRRRIREPSKEVEGLMMGRCDRGFPVRSRDDSDVGGCRGPRSVLGSSSDGLVMVKDGYAGRGDGGGVNITRGFFVSCSKERVIRKSEV